MSRNQNDKWIEITFTTFALHFNVQCKYLNTVGVFDVRANCRFLMLFFNEITLHDLFTMAAMEQQVHQRFKRQKGLRHFENGASKFCEVIELQWHEIYYY